MSFSQREFLWKMVEDGAAIGGSEISTLQLALADDIDGGLLFVSIFPEDQHNVHVVDYVSAETIGDVGLSLKKQDGSLVAYIARLDEWPDLDLDTEIAQHARWREWLESEKNRSDFETFLDSCKEDLSP